MLISRLVFVGWMFHSLVSVSFLVFRECVACMLPVFLICSDCVFPGIACWCWRLGYWDELEEERLEEKVFVISWRWGQRGRGDHSRFPTLELEMRLGELDLRIRRKGVALPLVYFLPSEEWSLHLQGGCLQVGVWDKATSE